MLEGHERGRVRHTSWVKIAGLLLSASALMASAQSAPEGKSQPAETQKRGYWIDPSTGLMWAGKDNGKNVSWHKAMKYCRDLRLAGYSDWRLATLEELRGIYDRDANAPGKAGSGETYRDFTWHVKGNLFLSGIHWSSTQVADNHGRTWGFAWRFDFNDGREFAGDELWFHTGKRALCVRDSGSAQSVGESQDGAQETQIRGHWIESIHRPDVGWKRQRQRCELAPSNGVLPRSTIGWLF